MKKKIGIGIIAAVLLLLAGLTVHLCSAADLEDDFTADAGAITVISLHERMDLAAESEQNEKLRNTAGAMRVRRRLQTTNAAVNGETYDLMFRRDDSGYRYELIRDDAGYWLNVFSQEKGRGFRIVTGGEELFSLLDGWMADK